jgi:hypothetical protein
MYQYQPAAQQYRHPAMAQAAAAVVPAPAPVVVDTMATAKKVATTLVTLGVLGSAAYVGIGAGMKSKNKTTQALGYIGGAGAALLGLAALSAFVAPKTVTNTLLLPFNLPSAA